MTGARSNGFRLGVYVFKDAEIVDFAAPYGVFSVARRFDPELDAFLIADAARPVQAQAGFTVLPNYSFTDCPAMDAFLIPGGFGTRQEMYNRRLHQFVQSLPQATLLTSVCTGSWVYGRMGLLDGVPATLMRHLLGDTVADMVGVPGPDWTRFLTAPVTLLNQAADESVDGSILARVAADTLGRASLRAMLVADRGGQRVSFRIPDELVQTWGINWTA